MASDLATPVPVARVTGTYHPEATSRAPSAGITPLSLLRAFRRRSVLALSVAIVAAGSVGPTAWFLLPTKFTAQTRLQVAAQPPKILFQTMETENLGGDSYKRYQSTQQTLVKSQLVLNAALRDPKVGGFPMIRDQVDPVAWLQEKLSVWFVSGSEVMEISLSGKDPEQVAGILNAVKKAYMDEVVDVDVKRRADRYSNLKKLKERYAESLKQRRETLRKLAETVGSDDRETLALRQQYAIEHQAYLQKELLDIQSKKRRLEALLKVNVAPEKAVTKTASTTLGKLDIDALVDHEPSVAGLLEKLADQQEKLDAKRAHLQRVARNPASDPALKKVSGDISVTRALLAQRRAAARPVVLRRLQEHGAAQQGQRSDEHGQELMMLRDLESRLKDELHSISLVNHKLTVNTLDLQSIKDEVIQMEAASTKVAMEVEALNVELSAPPRVRVIDDATVPRDRNDKKRFMMIGMAACGSFLAGLLGITFLEVLNRKVDTAADVPSELGLTVVGALPILPPRNHQRGAQLAIASEKDRYWHNLLLESIDATRTMLVHAARSGSHRVVMITSAVSGEGKTSLAGYLATSLARSGLRTLLVDADLRSPSLHRVFDLPRNPGLSELVRGEVEVDQVINTTPIEDLKVLAAGHCDRQALRILAQGCLVPLFEQLKQRFDFVIIDSSPILPVADALLIAQHADAVLFSIMQEVSRKYSVAAAHERLQSLGVHVLGAVVTGSHGRLYGKSDYDSDSPYAGLPESVAESSILSESP